jgi:hypothetical protein
MPWLITLHVTACAGGANLSGAFVTDGQSTVYTDSYGDVTLAIYDDVDPAYGVNVGDTGYNTRYTVLYQAQANTTQQVCLDAAPPPPPPGPGPHCFIVSATTGSRDSAENMRLNMLRDRVVRSTDIGATMLDAIYNDYYSFSPPIAEELAADAELRKRVLNLAVRPLLAWYGLIEVLALDPYDERAAERAGQRVQDACRAAAPSHARQFASLFAQIRRGEAVPEDAPEPFRYLASRLREAVKLPFSAWAIFVPLSLVWEGAAHDEDMVNQARSWLAEAPLDQLPPPSPGARLDAELERLASGPFASPKMRRQVGARLMSVWPQLERELGTHGFVDPRAP